MCLLEKKWVIIECGSGTGSERESTLLMTRLVFGGRFVQVGRERKVDGVSEDE